ncbi:MAG: hypothetical protein GY723_15865 [bacterium]|nr:hypothetical protein [bacterium]
MSRHPDIENQGGATWKRILWWCQRYRKPLSFTGRHYEIGRRMLLDTVDVLERNGIEYRVHAGTLLGLVRDGDLIPWDHDIDLIVPVCYLEQLYGAIGELAKAGLRPSRRPYLQPCDELAWRKGAERSLKIRNHRFRVLGRGIGRGRIVLDIFIAYPHAEHYWWSALNSVRRVPREYLDSYDVVQFAGRPIRVPHRHEEFLAMIFGDWRTPDPVFDSSVQDGTIVRPLGSLTPIRATRHDWSRGR